MNFLDRAQATVAKGAPVIRLRPRTKIAFDSDWPSFATTDPETLLKWNMETPEANCGAVAQARIGGVWFLEIDDPSVPDRIESETGQKIPLTYRVRSRTGRGHYYWKQTAESIAMGNVGQSNVAHGDFSVRVNNEYVVAANSIHPLSNEPYTVVCTAPIAECPQWLIEWIKAQKASTKRLNAAVEGEKIPHGRHDDTLFRIGCKLRNIGLEEEGIYNHLVEVCEKRCEGYGTDYLDMCRNKAVQACKYPVGSANPDVFFGSAPAGTTTKTAYGAQPARPLAPLVEDEETEKVELVLPPYPKFPAWVMAGTSIYEGLVKPFCDVNSRYAEYMFMPAVALMLNYLNNKVRIAQKQFPLSLFMVLIGRKGKIIKSSSVESAIEYFKYAGMVDHGNTLMENANGKALVWEIGSPEGLGLEMSRLKCKNAILFYDELSTLTNKAGIDGSTLTPRLLSMYESGNFQNQIKSKKESFSFEPGTYCVSLIACCTDQNFTTHWSKLSGSSSGLDERFFFLYQPEEFKPLTPQIHVSTQEASSRTRKLVDDAITKGTYKIEYYTPLQEAMSKGVENREEIRAEKFALYFAIDLGLDEIDPECVSRGLALVEYERAVKKYVQTYEATTREAAVQLELRRLLRNNRGEMPLRAAERAMHTERIGTTLWNQAYKGLLLNRIIRQVGTGKKGDPATIVLLQDIDDED